MVKWYIVIFNLNYIWLVVNGFICFEFDIVDLKHFIKNYLHYCGWKKIFSKSNISGWLWFKSFKYYSVVVFKKIECN